MEFISAEEFLKQPHKVQKVLQEWFIEKFETSNEFDLFNYNGEDLCYKNILDRNCNFDIEDCIPLLTEGQLRKFIEDKTEFPILKIELINGRYDIYTQYKAIDNYSDICVYDELGENLLQAYWKVAIQIAEQEGKQND